MLSQAFHLGAIAQGYTFPYLSQILQLPHPHSYAATLSLVKLCLHTGACNSITKSTAAYYLCSPALAKNCVHTICWHSAHAYFMPRCIVFSVCPFVALTGHASLLALAYSIQSCFLHSVLKARYSSVVGFHNATKHLLHRRVTSFTYHLKSYLLSLRLITLQYCLTKGRTG